MTVTHAQSLTNDPSTGLMDLFGTGGTSDGAAALYALPPAFDSVAGDGWFLAQWGQSSPIGPGAYVTNSMATDDPLYGDALYRWSSSATPSSFSIYQNNPAIGSGEVYQISLADETPASGSINESDSFLSSPAISPALGNLSHPITLSLNAKILESALNFVTAAAAQEFAGDPYIFNTIDFGFTVNFDGADGLPGYSGFVQIVPWLSNSTANSSYETIPISNNLSDPSQFIASLLLGSGKGLPLLPSDKGAKPVNLTYDVNQYVYAALVEAFAKFSGAQLSALLNLGNWSIGGMYLGLATNNQHFENLATDQYTSVADLSTTLQLSDIQLTSQTSQSYNPESPFTTSSAVDTNPKIQFYDFTASAGGAADGAVYIGTLPGIKNEYIYNGSDSLQLTAPQGSNWYFGGGTELTALNAVSGNNVFLASTGSSFMTGGSGDDVFDVPDANATDVTVWDTVVNFHPGDQVNLAGLAGTGWSYAWDGVQGAAGSTGLTLVAQSKTYPGLEERLTLAGLTSLTPAGGRISLVPNKTSGLLEIVYTAAAVSVPAPVGGAPSTMSFVAPSNDVAANAPAMTVGAAADLSPQDLSWGGVGPALAGTAAGGSNPAEVAGASLAAMSLLTAPHGLGIGWVAAFSKQAVLA